MKSKEKNENNKKIITNVIIILLALGSAILNAIGGLVNRLNLIAFILSCLMILMSVIEICMEMKKKK